MMADQAGDAGAVHDKEKEKLAMMDGDVELNMDLDDSKAHFINANGGAGGEHDIDDAKVKILDPTTTSSDGDVSFHGLGKNEVMAYADDPFWKKLRWILFILFWIGWFAMLVTAVVIIVLAPRCPPRPDLKWYQTEAVYQVLPKSFKDSNGDAYGDFGGLKEKEDYITEDLATKAIWISSMYLTDGMDSGIGIIDHKAIDPTFDVTVDMFKNWLKSMRKAGKKVILDLIPNQTSKNHTWFQNSVQKKDKYKDYYVWKDSADASGGPPNNWESVYGGPAWSYDDGRKAWYLHQFSESHPDLNLQNEDVREEIKDIMKFWLDAGVSGFHIRDLEYLVENPDLSDNDAENSNSRNYEGTLEFLKELRSLADDYSDKPGRERLLFGTVRHASKNQTMSYWGQKDEKLLHIVIPVLEKLNDACDASCVSDLLNSHLTDEEYQWFGLAVGNQDIDRIMSRIMKDKKKLTAIHALQMLLPGTPFNYYGDEFGQFSGAVPSGDAVDKQGRDNFRTPMQWNGLPNAGFAPEGIKPWLPINPSYASNNLEVGLAHFAEDPPIPAYKSLMKLRGKESFQWGKTKICAQGSDLLMFTRTASRFPFFLTLINLGASEQTVSLQNVDCVASKEMGTVVFHSRDEKVGEKLDFKEKPVQVHAGDVIVIEFDN